MVRIETEAGFGSGFLFAYNTRHTLAAFATAHHVIGDVDDWKKPIKIRHYTTDKVSYFEHADRVIFADRQNDTAIILVLSNVFDLPPTTLSLLPSRKNMKIGVEVGWTGFPSLFASDLCFFSGAVSFYKSRENAYIIDGVAIRGVSGGPVFSVLSESTPQIIGVISAYIRGGDSLPGLLMASNLTAVHNHIKTLQNFEDARQKEDELQTKLRTEALAKISVEKKPKKKPKKKLKKKLKKKPTKNTSKKEKKG